MVGLGGYHMAAGGERLAQQNIETALEEGIRFFDCAYKYLDGRSEEALGKFLSPKYREHAFIMSKADTRDPQIDSRIQLETSLKRMKTDYVDLWMTHTIVDSGDAERRIAEMLEVAEKAKEEGKIRYFGFTGHKATEAHLKAIEMVKGMDDVSCLMPISPVDFVSKDSFTVNVLPGLIENQIIPLAMKTMNAGRAMSEHEGKSVIPGRLSFEENQWFVLSLPVATWVSGMQNPDHVRQNVDIARRFTALTEADRLAIAERVLDVKDVAGLQPYRQWNT